jgi:hypothetical protein
VSAAPAWLELAASATCRAAIAAREPRPAPCGARRHRISEDAAVAELGQPGIERAGETRAAAEQALAAADLEQQAAFLHGHLRRILVGPEREFGQRIALAFGVAFDGEVARALRGRQLDGARCRRAPPVAVDDEALRRAVDDYSGACARSRVEELQRQRGQ